MTTFSIGLGHNSPEYIHVLMEALRISFAAAGELIADPGSADDVIKYMLCEDRAREWSKKISQDRCLSQVSITESCMMTSSDTIYLTVTDCNGNACSFINSNYMGFGTGIVPKGCGFTLQVS